MKFEPPGMPTYPSTGVGQKGHYGSSPFQLASCALGSISGTPCRCSDLQSSPPCVTLAATVDAANVTGGGRGRPDKRCYGKRRNGTLPALAYNSARSMILLANSVSAVCSRGGGFQTAAITPSDVHRKDGFECRRTWSASSPTVSFYGVTPSCRCRRCATPPLGSSALRSE
jgi:hypothetical protein